ncbi:MAG: tetratricopeptide repeat protein, partial [Sphingobacteriales bacterium]
YKQIPEGDTAYLLSIYEQAISQLADTNYAEAIALAKKALDRNYTDRRQMLLTMGSALDEMGKADEAIRLYDSTMALYPNDHRPYYEKAVVLFKKKQYKEAESLLQQGLMLNPQHFRSHFLLGSLYSVQGRFAEAIMALQAALLCTNNATLAQHPISLLSAIATQTGDIAQAYSDRKPEYAHPLFDEIDELVHAKIALNKGYALKTDIDDNIARQIQIVSEKLTYDSKDKNFAMQYYVPLFKKVYDDNQFESMILLLFSEYGIQSIDKMANARKGKARLEELKNMVFPYLNKIEATRELNYEKRQSSTERYHVSDQGRRLVVGVYADDTKKKFAAGSVQYFEEQILLAEGNYDKEGRKTGVWNYYYSWDKPKLREEYKDGVLTGELIGWHENGNVRFRTKVNAEGVPSERNYYSYNGLQASKSFLKGKNEYEITYFYNDGSVRKVSTLIGDKLKDGSYTINHPNGKVSRAFSYRNDKLEGADKSYYDNGKPEESSTYVDGQLEGEVLTYHENGNRSGKFNYLHGKKNGASEEYREDGSLSLKRNYVNGKSDGLAQYFDKDGRMYYELTFNKDRMTQAKLYGTDGKVISEQNGKNTGANEYYNEYGRLRARVATNDDGLAHGKASYYYI